jgi:hypothetical protein
MGVHYAIPEAYQEPVSYISVSNHTQGYRTQRHPGTPEFLCACPPFRKLRREHALRGLFFGRNNEQREPSRS